MKEHLDEPFDPMVVDYHLGQLEPHQIPMAEAAIASSPGLAAQSRAVADALGLLDSWKVPLASVDLADRVLERVAAEGTPAFSGAGAGQGSSALPPGAESELSASPFLSIRELVAVAACITIFAGVFVPGYYRAANMARRTACADHMRQVAAAAGVYSQAHAGALPFAGAVANASWLPVKTPGVRVVSNRRHPYLLLKMGFVRDPEVFICPACESSIPMVARSYEEFGDFAESRNISYVYQNMNAGPIRNVESVGRLALLSDQNPLFAGGRIHLIEPYQENSVVHGGRGGQNVAFVDGSVGWTTTPAVGIRRDNIFRAGRKQRYTGTEVPQSPTDSFLIP